MAAPFNLEINGTGIDVPGGPWKTLTLIQDAAGKFIATGTGTDGNVYATYSTDGATWEPWNWPF
jgi:hypothetical protein